MSEKNFQKTTRRNMKKAGRTWQRIETGLTGEGVPDTYFCINGSSGWIESKYINAYPKRETTPIKIKLSGNQEAWLSTHDKAGGRGFVFLQIGRDYYLFNKNWNKLVKGLLLQDLQEESIGFWKNAVNWEEFTSLLIN